ncbi:MAG: methionyl-tRNA formyltransferase [Candidatus Endobugula sp.]
MPTNKQNTSLKIIFAGTPPFAAHHLQALMDSEHQVVAVYTQPDRPSGRGKKLTASPVKTLAHHHRLAVEQPVSLKEIPAQQVLASYHADVMVVVAYGLLLPQAVLDIPACGCLNVHASLLPRWRGAAPIQRAVESGDKTSGVTIMQMDKGLDTGDMLFTLSCDIDATETSASLHDKLMLLGAPALLDVLQKLPSKTLPAKKQNNDLACYAAKITKQEAEINWLEPAEKIVKKIQAFNPYPIAYTWLESERIKIHSAEVEISTIKKMPGEIINVIENGLIIACGENQVRVNKLQIPNKKAMTVKELLNGYADRFSVGQKFSNKK